MPVSLVGRALDHGVVCAAASFHSISGTEVWAEDVVEPCSYHEIINGTIRVTDSPGLGVTVNRYGVKP